MRCGALISRSLAASLLAALSASAAKVWNAPAPVWNQAAAARYLDARATWWESWPVAQRDHGTVCISCHTAVPYALARPALRERGSVEAFAAPERIMVNDIARRVALWHEVEPFYKDGQDGPTKSIESRSTEAVLNALILASYDERRGHLSELTRSAFRNAWALQRKTGDKAGAWIWLNFHNAPWESNESEYQGAALAALAVGIAPDQYASDPKIQPDVALLRTYLRREYKAQPVLNQVILLWGSAKLPGFLTQQERLALVDAVLAKQQSDGGWSLTGLGNWKRQDKTALETRSDGYATGIVLVALEANGRRELPQVTRGLKWLAENQSPREGLWNAWSLNEQRDTTSDVGRFMSDAATGFAVLALEKSVPNATAVVTRRPRS